MRHKMPKTFENCLGGIHNSQLVKVEKEKCKEAASARPVGAPFRKSARSDFFPPDVAWKRQYRKARAKNKVMNKPRGQAGS